MSTIGMLVCVLGNVKYRKILVNYPRQVNQLSSSDHFVMFLIAFFQNLKSWKSDRHRRLTYKHNFPQCAKCLLRQSWCLCKKNYVYTHFCFNIWISYNNICLFYVYFNIIYFISVHIFRLTMAQTRQFATNPFSNTIWQCCNNLDHLYLVRNCLFFLLSSYIMHENRTRKM